MSDHLVVSEVFGPTFQGEGPSAGRRAGFVRLGRCNLTCDWCFVPDTPVLLADRSYRPIGELTSGVEVLGVTRPQKLGAHMTLAVGTVVAVSTRLAPTVVVNQTTRCTADHKFWATGRGSESQVSARSGWREVSRLQGLRARFIAEPPAKQDLLLDRRGWLAGMADGRHTSRVISTVEPTCQLEPVVALTTTVGTFVANGFVVKNCDTPYTWDWDRYDQTVELSTATGAEVLLQLESMGVDLVVITGGEPLLQQRRLGALLEGCRERGWRVEVETNGTIAPTVAGDLVGQWNVSPKLANSGVPPAKRYRPDVLRTFEATGRAVFKFVVTDRADLDEIQDMVDQCQLSDVWVMPEGTDADTVTTRLRALAETVMARGWHLTPRLHILVWGDRRGV